MPAPDPTPSAAFVPTTNGTPTSPDVWPVDLVEYTQGQLVVREGELADCAFLIQAGEVEVFKHNPSGRRIHIAQLGPQEIFGEMCLFVSPSRRTATVQVRSDRALIMSISKTNFQKQLDTLPEGMRTIIRILIRRLCTANEHITLLS